MKGRRQEKINYCEGAYGHRFVKRRQQEKINYCEDVCGHVAL
jgi:hypothetical protein